MVKVYYPEKYLSKFKLIFKKILIFILINIIKRLNLSTNDSLIIFRYGHHTFAEILSLLDQIGFDVMHSTTSHDGQQIFVAVKLKNYGY